MMMMMMMMMMIISPNGETVSDYEEPFSCQPQHFCFISISGVYKLITLSGTSYRLLSNLN